MFPSASVLFSSNNQHAPIPSINTPTALDLKQRVSSNKAMKLLSIAQVFNGLHRWHDWTGSPWTACIYLDAAAEATWCKG
jgi:hypothetical protein